MDPEAIAVIIPVMALAIPFYAMWVKHKREVMRMQLEATADSTAERAAQYATRVQELEDRVRVLERIVTDGGYDVAKQIEALRDQNRVEKLLEDSAKPVG